MKKLKKILIISILTLLTIFVVGVGVTAVIIKLERTDEQEIKITTEKKIGDIITVKVWTKESDKNSVWFDFNNNKQKDDKEDISLYPYNKNLHYSYAEVKFPLESQEFTLFGRITELDCTSQKIIQLSFLNGYFDYLKKLNCSYNLLTTLDVTEQPLLKRLKCNNNKLGTLDISNNKKLQYLYCNKNELTALTLDTSNNQNLEQLDCTENELTALDVSNNQNLQELNCGMNKLTVLDVSQNKELYKLRCLYNNITQLNVSKNIKLRELSCRGNLLETINILYNINLRDLSCGQNKLKSIDVSRNKYLSAFGCGQNSLLTQLDVSENKNLRKLYCENTQLTKLDLFHNEDLTDLYCENTPLNELDIFNNKKLSGFRCDDRLALNSKLSYFTSEEEEYLITAESALIVRERPTTKSQRLGKLEFNKTIQAKKTNIPFYVDEEYEEIRDYWYEVMYEGKIAYVFGGFIEQY